MRSLISINLAATVMKAISRTTSQWFAIKTIHESKDRRVTANDNKSGGDKAEYAFMREITILEDLDYPNICKLRGMFRDRGNAGMSDIFLFSAL